MSNLLKYLMLCYYCLLMQFSFAQGPPILGGKPVMLGAKSSLLKTLTEIRSVEQGVFVKAPFMIHYLPTANSLVGLHVPLVSDNIHQNIGLRLGNVQLLAKYQFYRKDKTAKTFRMVIKSLQTLPAPHALNVREVSWRNFQSYWGVVAGYESVKYGISNELGFNCSPFDKATSLNHKLSIGLPLLKSTYPVKQLNLYFEYQNAWWVYLKEFEMLYAQGIQWAKGQYTFEIAIQFPLVQQVSAAYERNWSCFMGMRHVF